MRLRYLHLQNLPPLKDIWITFGKDEILQDRAYSIHFIVGINGTGKSRLLQALTEVFLALERRSLPAFPVTLAYDLEADDKARTIYLYHPNTKSSATKLIEFAESLPQDTPWQEMEFADEYEDEDEEDEDEEPFYPVECAKLREYRGDNLPGSGTIVSLLPGVVLAYTSGAAESWFDLFAPAHRELNDYLDETYTQNPEQPERPVDWNELQDRLYQREQPGRQPQQTAETQRESLLPAMREISGIGLFVSSDDLKLALCAVALQQAITDFRQMPDKQAEKRFVAAIDEAVQNDRRQEGLRGIFNEVGWLWPVTLSLRMVFRPELWNTPRVAQLTRLYHLATRVVREPEPGDGRLLVFDLRSPARTDSSRTTAEALFAAIGGEDAEVFAVFHELMRWKQEGWLLDVMLTLRKRNVDDLLLYDWLSDGERMFLSRIALLYVLQGQENALIILDEPETHFNDYWKREIVDIIHSSLKHDPCEIVLSTHSSIALTDVLSEEIIVLRQDKETGLTEVLDEAPIPTFGADPGEIMVHVFFAANRQGKRSIEYIKDRIRHEWKPEQKDELERLILATGAGYYHAELRLKWMELNATQN